MKGYRIAAMAVIGVLCCNTMAFAAPKPLEEAYEKNGNSYIKKTYVINNTEEIVDTMDTTFELNGLVYHQIDISSKPVVEVLTKDVKQTEETTVASRNDAAVLKKLGATKQYTDEEGYQTTLKAEREVSTIRFPATPQRTRRSMAAEHIIICLPWISARFQKASGRAVYI